MRKYAKQGWAWYRKLARGWQIAGAVVVAFLVLGIIGSATDTSKPKTQNASASKPTTTTAPKATTTTTAKPTTTTTAKPTTTTSTTAAGPKVSKQAVSYIKAHLGDANRVQAAVEVVQIQIGLVLQKGDAISASDVNDLALRAQDSHDALDAIRDNFASGADGTGKNQDWEVDIFSGAEGLKNSMGALVKWTGDPNPANLASFSSQYRRAVAQWNEGVTNLWAAAQIADPPTIPTS